MLKEWSGRWESNPRLKLGKLGYYHYTTPATSPILVAFRRVGKWRGCLAANCAIRIRASSRRRLSLANTPAGHAHDITLQS